MYKAKFAEHNGNIPFLDFLESINIEEKAEILASIDKFLELKNSSNRITIKLSKYLMDGIFEIRVKHQNKISRSLYFYEKDKVIVFTNGFIKKTEKVPLSEIRKALKIKKNQEE
jgi:phage-related protein